MPATLLVLPIPDEKLPGGIILAGKTTQSINPYCKALVVDKGSATSNYPMTEFVRYGKEIILMPRSAGTVIVADGVAHKVVHVSEVIGYWCTKENLEEDNADI